MAAHGCIDRGLNCGGADFCHARSEAAKAAGSGTDSGTLLEMAAKLFPGLTRAERALLEHADVKNVGRGDYAVAGTSDNPDDPSNDPKDAAKWDGQRQIRASLIRWMCVDPDAIRRIDPQGIRVLGAKIVEKLNLTGVKVLFAINLRRCAIPELMRLQAMEIPALSLRGSYIGRVDGYEINVDGELALWDGFHADGQVDLAAATLGSLLASNGHFRWLPGPHDPFSQSKVALLLLNAR